MAYGSPVSRVRCTPDGNSLPPTGCAGVHCTRFGGTTRVSPSSVQSRATHGRVVGRVGQTRFDRAMHAGGRVRCTPDGNSLPPTGCAGVHCTRFGGTTRVSPKFGSAACNARSSRRQGRADALRPCGARWRQSAMHAWRQLAPSYRLRRRALHSVRGNHSGFPKFGSVACNARSSRRQGRADALRPCNARWRQSALHAWRQLAPSYRLCRRALHSVRGTTRVSPSSFNRVQRTVESSAG
jgi:hypothetical protein